MTAGGSSITTSFNNNGGTLDIETGKPVWKHASQAFMWGSTFVADGKVFVGDATGTLWILAAGREKKVLNKIKFDSTIYQTPVFANGVLYVCSEQRLYAIPAAGTR